MSNIINIQSITSVDRNFIDAAITASENITIGFVDSNLLESEIVINDLNSDNLEAFKKVMDFATFSIMENAKIWNIQTTDKAFDLSNSYIRDVESTETPLTEIPDGTPLIVQFETPSFTAFRVTQLSLWYGQDFVPEEIDALSAIGISVSGNGTNFTVRNTIECRINFIKPEIITDLYVINNEAQNQIIPI